VGDCHDPIRAACSRTGSARVADIRPTGYGARALAASLDADQLAGVVRLLERPENQDWIELQLEIYPVFANAVLQQAVAAGEVMAEEMISTYGEEQPLDFEPVTASPLAAVFAHVPGSRVEATLEQGMYFHEVRIPVEGGVLAAAFDDYTLHLLPDGDAARAASISAERAFRDMAACDLKRRQLEVSLAALFDDSQDTDCGFTRHLSAGGGDTRMTLQCSEQKLLGAHARLKLDIIHEPTRQAMYSQAVTWDDPDQSNAIEDTTAQDP